MSREIDEKVVSLEFDNNNFERYAQQSIETIKKLNESLQFKGVKEGSEKTLTSIQNLQNVDFSAMSHNLSIISSQFDEFGLKPTAIFRNIRKEVDKTATSILNLVRNGTVGNIYSGGLNRAMKLADARFKLSGTLDEAKDVEAVMNSVNNAVAGTAYSLDEAATVASQLVATGLRGGKEMDGILRGISGTAAMTGARYEEIGHIFTRVSGNGKLMAIELRQLSTRGLNAAANLAKVFNKAIEAPEKLKSSAMSQEVIDSIKKLSSQANITEQDIHKMVTKGQIDFKMFAAAMDEAFGEHAKKANTTLKGVWANMRAAFAKIGADFLTPIVDNNSPLVKFLDAVRLKVAAIRDFLTPISERGAEIVNGIISKATKVVNTLNLTEPLQQIQKMFKPWDGLKEAIKGAGISVDEFKKKFISLGEQNNWFEKGTIDVKNFKDHIRDGFFTVEHFSDVIYSLSQTTKKQAKDTGEFAEKLQVMQKVVDEVWHGDWGNMWDRWNALKAAGYDYIEVQDLVNKTVDKHRLTLKDLGISTKKQIKITESDVKAFRKLEIQAKKSGTSLNTLINSLNKKTVFDLFNTTISNITKSMTGFIKALKDGLIEGLGSSKLGTSIYNLLHNILSITSKIVLTDTAMERLKNTIKGVVMVFDTFATILIDFVSGLIGANEEAGNTVTNLIEGFLGITSFISTIVQNMMLFINKIIDAKKFGELLKPIFSGIYITIGWIAKTIGDIFAAIGDLHPIQAMSNTMKAIMEIINKIVEMFKGWFVEIGKIKASIHIMDTLRGIIDKIVSLFGTSKEKVDGFFKSFKIKDNVLKSLDFINEKVTKFLKSIKDVDFNFDFSGFITFATSLKEKFQNTLKQIDLKSIGSNIVEGLHLGILGKFGEVIGTFVAKAKEMIDSFCTTFGIASPSTVMITIGGFIISGLVLGLRNGLFGLTKTGDLIGETTKEGILKGLTRCVQDIQPSVEGIWGGLSDTVTKTLKDFTLNDAVVIGGLLSFTKAVGVTTSALDRLVGRGGFFGKKGTGIVGFVDAFTDLTLSIKKIPSGIGKILGTLNTSIKRVTKSYIQTHKMYAKLKNKKINAVLLAEIIIGIVVVCREIQKIAEIPHDRLVDAIHTLAAITGAMVILLGISSVIDPKKAFSAASVVGAMGLSVKMIVSAIHEMYEIIKDADESGSYDKLWAAVGAIAITIIALGGLALLISNYASGSDATMVKGAVFLLGIAAALDLLVLAFWGLSKLDQDSLYRSVTVISILGIVLGLAAGLSTIMLASSKDQIVAMGEMMLCFSGAIFILSLAIKIIDGISEEGVVKAIAVIGYVTLLFAAISLLTLISNPASMEVAGSMFIKFSVAVGILAFSIMAINLLTPEMILKGFTVITMFASLCSAMMVVSLFAGKAASSAGSMFLKFSASCLIMVLAIKAINMLTEEEIDKGIDVIKRLETLFIVMMAVSKFAGQNASQAGTMLLKVSVALVILSLALGILSKIPADELYSTTGAITVIILALGDLITCTKDFKAENVNGLIKFIASLAIVFIALGVLSTLNKNNEVLSVAIGISLVLEALGDSMKRISTVDKVPDVKSLAKMIGFVVGIAAVLAVLLIIQNKYGSSDNLQMITMVGSICALIEVLTLSMTQLSKIKDSGNVDKGIKQLLKMSGILLLVGGVFVALSWAQSKMNMSPTAMLSFAATLSLLLVALTGCLAILSTVNVSSGAGGTAGAELVKFVAIVGGFAAAVGVAFGVLQEVSEKFFGDNNLVNILKKGMEVTNTIADLIGEFIGHLFGSIKTGIDATSVKSLQQLADGYKNFANSLKDVDPKSVDGAKNLMKVLLMTSASEFIDKITGGEQEYEKLNESVGAIADAVITFNNKIKNEKFDESKIGPAIKMAQGIANFEKTLPRKGGWVGNILGDRESLKKFAEGIGPFVDSMLKVNKKLQPINEEDLQNSKLNKIAKMGTMMSKLAESMQRSGGSIEKFIGKKVTIEDFAKEIGKYADEIVKISKKLQKVDVDSIDLGKMKKITKAGTLFSDLAKSLDRKGGWTDNIFGSKDSLPDFSKNIKEFTKGLLTMIELIPDNLDTSKAEALVTLSSSINDIQNNLKESGGAKGFLFGNKEDIGSFGDNIEKFGLGLSNFALSVQDLDTTSLLQASIAVSMISNMASPEILDNFQPGTFALKLDQFCDSMTDLKTNFTKLGIKDILKEINGLSDLANAIVAIGTNNIDLTSFLEAIEQLKSINLTELADSLANSGEVAGELTSVMSNIIKEMANTITNEGGTLTDAFTTVISKTASSIKTDKFSTKGRQSVQSFKAGIAHATSIATSAAASLGTVAANAMYVSSEAFTAGYNMGCKLADGLKETWWIVADAGSYIGQKAYEAALNAIDNKKGSKSSNSFGVNLGYGVRNGIIATTSLVSMAANGMGDAIEQGIQRSISTPTITPVLDMTSINAEQIQLSSKMMSDLDVSITGVGEMLFSVKDEIYKSNNEVIQAVNNLNDKISEFLDGDPSEIAFYVDGKKLTSTTAKNMNIELGKLSRRKVR